MEKIFEKIVSGSDLPGWALLAAGLIGALIGLFKLIKSIQDVVKSQAEINEKLLTVQEEWEVAASRYQINSLNHIKSILTSCLDTLTSSINSSKKSYGGVSIWESSSEYNYYDSARQSLSDALDKVAEEISSLKEKILKNRSYLNLFLKYSALIVIVSFALILLGLVSLGGNKKVASLNSTITEKNSKINEVKIDLEKVITELSDVRQENISLASNRQMISDELEKLKYENIILKKISGFNDKQNFLIGTTKKFEDLYVSPKSSLTLTLIDHSSDDGDIVNIFINNEIFKKDVLLNSSGITFDIEIKNGYYPIRIEAVNEGASSPNTAKVVVKSDNQIVFEESYGIKQNDSVGFVMIVGEYDN